MAHWHVDTSWLFPFPPGINGRLGGVGPYQSSPRRKSAMLNLIGNARERETAPLTQQVTWAVGPMGRAIADA